MHVRGIQWKQRHASKLEQLCEWNDIRRGCAQGWKPLSSLGKVADIHHGTKMRTNTYKQPVLVSNNIKGVRNMHFGVSQGVARGMLQEILHRSNTSADTSALTKELYSLGKTCKEKEKVCGFYIVPDFCCHVYINATYVYKYRLKTHEHKHRHRYIDCVVEASWLVKWLAWILENILLSNSNWIFSNCDSAISVIHSISNWKLRDADQQKKTARIGWNLWVLEMLERAPEPGLIGCTAR